MIESEDLINEVIMNVYLANRPQFSATEDRGEKCVEIINVMTNYELLEVIARALPAVIQHTR